MSKTTRFPGFLSWAMLALLSGAVPGESREKPSPLQPGAEGQDQPSTSPTSTDRPGFFGNTFSGLNYMYVPHSAVVMYTTPDGVCYTNTPWEEGGHNVRAYKAPPGGMKGEPLGPYSDSAGNAGWAVAADDTHVWASVQPKGRDGRIAIQRWERAPFEAAAIQGSLPHTDMVLRTGVADSGRGGVQPIIAMAVYGGELFVADHPTPIDEAADPDHRGPHENTVVKVFDANRMNGTVLRSWAVPRARRLAFDRQGFLWVLQQRNAGTPPKVVRYDRNGVLQPPSISASGSQEFVSIACDPNADRILIGDNGPDQNVKIYANITTTPALQKTFGITGGYLSTAGGAVRGSVGNLRFDCPLGVGIDSGGNIYVLSTQTAGIGDRIWAYLELGRGAILESYTSGGTLRWRAEGLEFVDAGELDPGSEVDVYTGDSHYTVDLNTSPVTWTHKGRTADYFTYPNDIRKVLDHRVGSNGPQMRTCWARRIGGALFLFMTTNGLDLWWYRMDRAALGEIARPAGALVTGAQAGLPGPAYLWVDGDGDGIDDGGAERTSLAAFRNPVAPWPDADGNVWILDVDNSRIRTYPRAGFNGVGNPTYGSPTLYFTLPAPYTGGLAQRVRFYPSLDGASNVMILGGYRPEDSHARRSWFGNDKACGRTLTRYDDWFGARTFRWSIDLPWNTRTISAPIGMDAAGSYLIVCWLSGQSEGFHWGGPFRVYRLSDGSLYKTFSDPFFRATIGDRGWIDMRDPITLRKRANGEYVAICEEDFLSKMLTIQFK